VLGIVAAKICRMQTLLIATRNQHKVEEIKAILGQEFAYLSLNELAGAPETKEDATTFAGNATKKAVELAHWVGANAAKPGLIADVDKCLVLADDSGLEVDALNGAPGVHAARFAALDTAKAGNSPTLENNAKLLRLLQGVPEGKRKARFRCAIAWAPVVAQSQQHRPASEVCYADETEFATRVFEGKCEGRIIETPRGAGGFGYDPLFIPEGYEKTFGELPEGVKNRLSHRARALEKLKQALRLD